MKVKYVNGKLFDISTLELGDKCICHIEDCNNWFKLKDWYYCSDCITTGIKLLQGEKNES